MNIFVFYLCSIVKYIVSASSTRDQHTHKISHLHKYYMFFFLFMGTMRYVRWIWNWCVPNCIYQSHNVICRPEYLISIVGRKWEMILSFSSWVKSKILTDTFSFSFFIHFPFQIHTNIFLVLPCHTFQNSQRLY